MPERRGRGSAGGRHTLLVAVLAVALAACAGPESQPGADPETPATSPRRDRGASPGADTPPSPLLDQLQVELVPVVSGLEAPLFATHSGDGSGRMFVVEQTGRVRIVENERLRSQPYLDISAKIVAGGEQGLLGLAFHPDYATNGRLFVNYTDLRGDTVVAEYRRHPRDELRADPASERVLLHIAQPFVNHNGGGLAFGPDGYLYIGTGDGGSGGDPLGNGQALDTLLGKLLRIDVDSTASGPYGIPPDNPFASSGSARPEIWAYGLRNPWRFSFDRPTGTLWIGDVGQSELEEVNRAPAGAPRLNYGWNVTEGSSCYEPPQGCDTSGLEPPIATYSHAQGCSITGGYVYRGDRYPVLEGAYLFADYCSGTIWSLNAAGGSPQRPVELVASERALSSFGEDEAGELYVTDIRAGELLRLAASRR